MRKLMTVAAGVLAAAAAWGGRVYTVETTGGVPRIHIDGQAVPARIFFGCEPEVCEATVGTDWTEAECFFRVFSDCAGKGSYRVTFPDARAGDTVELGLSGEENAQDLVFETAEGEVGFGEEVA